jgi:hypothetical protein
MLSTKTGWLRIWMCPNGGTCLPANYCSSKKLTSSSSSPRSAACSHQWSSWKLAHLAFKTITYSLICLIKLSREFNAMVYDTNLNMINICVIKKTWGPWTTVLGDFKFLCRIFYVWIYPTQREVLAIMPLQQIDKKFKLPILSLTICTSCIK